MPLTISGSKSRGVSTNPGVTGVGTCDGIGAGWLGGGDGVVVLESATTATMKMIMAIGAPINQYLTGFFRIMFTMTITKQTRKANNPIIPKAIIVSPLFLLCYAHDRPPKTATP